jgi:transcriptional regulator with XRE-family HTH domain
MESTTDLRHTPRSLRARLGLTQGEVAKRAGVSLRTITNIEAGADLGLANLRAIAGALEIPIEVLVGAIDTVRARKQRRRASRQERGSG